MDLKPHKVKSWVHTPIENQPEFDRQVQEICTLYAQSQALLQQGIHLTSCDEKTGIQAVERKHTPMQPKQPERQDYEYIRHGTQCLIASFEVATGRIPFATISDTRKEPDFAAHIYHTIQTAPNDAWIFIVDQLNTHQSEALVRLVNNLCNLQLPLGTKQKDGVLKTMESRARFLSDPSHRIRFTYTPKHASWLNQVEVWFSILVRRLLKRLSTSSVLQLKQKIEAFIAYFNQTMAKAFKWTYKADVLVA